MAGAKHHDYHLVNPSVWPLVGSVAALVMFNLGSGPVRGFALTLVIGVITSFFTVVIVARWIMAVWLKTFRPKWIPI